MNLSTGTITYLVADASGRCEDRELRRDRSTASTDYDAWGNPETSGGLSSLHAFRLRRGLHRSDGLVYLIGRYYDPATGQFLSVDPLLSVTSEPYLYTADDPINDADPLGTITFPTHFLLVEYGGLGKYEADVICKSDVKCTLEWFLSLEKL